MRRYWNARLRYLNQLLIVPQKPGPSKPASFRCSIKNEGELDGRALNVNEARPKTEGGRIFSRGPQGGGRQRREPRW